MILMKIKPSENPTIEVSRSYLQKRGISYFVLPEERTWMRVYLLLFFFFFPSGMMVSKPMILKVQERAHWNGNKKNSSALSK